MPFNHTRVFRVRNYECDAYGHLNNANYLRYMQEAAFDASAAGGYDLELYNQLKRYWLIYATEIDYLQPVNYNETLQVTTWVADFRRASSRRRYEFSRPGETKPVAQAYTDWLFLNAETNQPASVPLEMKTAFFPEGVPDSFPSRAPYISAPPPPPGAFTLRRTVEWQDIDMRQHVNNAVYLDYASECGYWAIDALGWPWRHMYQAGFGLLLRRNQIQYLQPARLGDELLITTWLSDVRAVQAWRHYHIQRARDGATLAWIHALRVCVDLATGKPMRWPKPLLSDIASTISPPSE